MREQKVYVDDELLIYDDFSLCCTKNFDNTFYTNNYSLIDNEEYFEAYFQSIKTHDRELVKEVCEKIKEQLGFIVDGQERIICDGSATGDKTILAVLKQIQKDFENGEI